MHHNFSSRLNRSASELLILTIIQSKGNAYPYEIYKSLLSEIFYIKLAEIEKSSHLITFSKNYIKYLEDPTTENEMLLMKDMRGLFPASISSEELKLTTHNNKKESIKNLSSLLKEAERFVKNQTDHLQIWKSKTAIYQVMKDLEEKEKLIAVVDIKIINGRSRKIYSITDKGREVAIKWILEFGDLYHRISPKISQFTGTESSFIKSHRFQVLKYMEKFIPVDSIAKLLMDDSGSPFSQLLKGLFPIIGNPSKLKTLLLSDEFQFDYLTRDIPSKYKTVYREILLKQMNEFKLNIEIAIDYLKNEEVGKIG